MTPFPAMIAGRFRATTDAGAAARRMEAPRAGGGLKQRRRLLHDRVPFSPSSTWCLCHYHLADAHAAHVGIGGLNFIQIGDLFDAL